MFFASLSARRAWIEIQIGDKIPQEIVASLSARRAWIEISILPKTYSKDSVALRKESVDRNNIIFKINPCACRRSPQGERG